MRYRYLHIYVNIEKICRNLGLMNGVFNLWVLKFVILSFAFSYPDLGCLFHMFSTMPKDLDLFLL